MGKVFDALFGCWHQRYSFPITVKAGVRRNKAAALTGTYVVCLDCGKEFGYDSQSPTSAVRSFATKEAA